MLKKIINTNEYEKYLGVIFLFCSAIGVGISFKNLYLFHFAIPLFLFYLLVNKNFKSQLKPILLRKINLSFIGILIVLIISILWAESKVAAVNYIIQYCVGISIVFALQFFIQTKSQLNFYLKYVGGTLLSLLILIGLLESFTPFRWPVSAYSDFNEFFGRSDLISNLREIELIKGYSDASPSVFFWNTNNLAYFIGMILPFFLNWKWKNVLVVVLLVLLLLFSGSKIIVMLLLASTMFYVFKNQIKLLFIILIGFIIVTPILSFPDSILAVKSNEIFVSLTGQNIRFSDKYLLPEELNNDLDESSSGAMRKELYIFGMKQLVSTKFIGVGAGNVSFKSKSIAHKTNGTTSIHNYWIEIAANGGLIVILLYGFILLTMILYFLKITDNDLKIKFLQSIFILFFGAMSISSNHYFLPYYVVMGVFITILYNQIKFSDAKQ
jgi:hypothetical protein